MAIAQENYLVSTQDSVLSLYDLATNTPLASMKSYHAYNILPGPNNRLAFVLAGTYLSVIDTTIQHEISRLTDVTGGTAAMTPDGKLLLVPGDDGWLRFVDTATLQVSRKVSIGAVLGKGWTGAILIAANKAYVFPYLGPLSNVAVIDLANDTVSAIALPEGYFEEINLASVTPDGKTIAAYETELADSRNHVILISTSTNTIAGDYPQSIDLYFPYALVVTPNGGDPSKIFGYLAVTSNLGDEVVALDLRINSPTYGQLLLDTAVYTQLTPDALAINSDGTRLIAVGYPYSSPGPNTYVIDALKMITDPSGAVIAQITVDNGAPGYAVSTGFFSTTSPNTAPVVSGVSGNITNDADHEIQITGGNFQQGALVHIGSMAPLAASVTGSSSLSVTVPANAPAGKAIDIVVTNPDSQGPQDQQNQSGVLAGQFNILLNPKFEPTTPFVTVNLGDFSTSVYDFAQRAMVNVPPLPQSSYIGWPAFDLNGKEIYYDSVDLQRSGLDVVPLSIPDYSWEAPIAPNGGGFLYKNLVASLDPLSGKAVINQAWRVYQDLRLSVIDSDPNSPTFHTVIRTWSAGLNVNGVYGYGMEVTPDGKFAFIFYRTGYPQGYYLGTMDLATGAFTYVNATDLGVGGLQQQTGVQMGLSPDGKSLLLTAVLGNRSRIIVCDVSQPHQPKQLVRLTPKPIPGYGPPNIVSSRIAGNRLYAFDSRGIIVIFNFSRNPGDFRERGCYIYPNFTYGFKFNFEFSPDGQWLYVADPVNDLVAVLDPAKLIAGNDVVVTTLRAPYYAYRLAVSPVPPPSKAVAHAASTTRRRN